MRRAFPVAVVGSLLTAMVLAACGGGSPTQPIPPPKVEPPANIAPAIDSITVQGRRPRQPARFADVRETVDVTATVRDPETSLDELTYQWTATAGTFTGIGRVVSWTAPDASPDAATTPAKVTLTLKVIENYGHPGQPKNFSQEVSSTVDVGLHDSVKEVAAMSGRFLTEFSKPQSNQNWQDIMRDFKASACPQSGDVDAERIDVVNHYTNFVMHVFAVGVPRVTVNFGAGCAFRNRLGDACAVVPVSWDSTDKRDGSRRQTIGLDHIAAAYSPGDNRWWLCASDLQPAGSVGHSFYSR